MIARSLRNAHAAPPMPAPSPFHISDRDRASLRFGEAQPARIDDRRTMTLAGHVLRGVSVETIVNVTPADDSGMDILVTVARDMVKRGERPAITWYRNDAGDIIGISLAREVGEAAPPGGAA